MSRNKLARIIFISIPCEIIKYDLCSRVNTMNILYIIETNYITSVVKIFK